MKKRHIVMFILGILTGLFLMAAGLSKTAAFVAEANAQEVVPQPLAEKLLEEFLIISTTYTPDRLTQRAMGDPTFSIMGAAQKGTLVYVQVQLPDGVMLFGYPGVDTLPICTIFISAVQPYKQMERSDRFKQLVKDVTEAFGQEPANVYDRLNIIVFNLDEDINLAITLYPDGTVTVGTGFKKNFVLPKAKDA
jgi:hypothetical protein